ncbi:MAG: hypothetical protein EON59_03780 [Alphaproteobacteria bacterium]|nr:MAG: hypothetical protein EON59_03780 [Alphaproteobacteria bacterium]
MVEPLDTGAPFGTGSRERSQQAVSAADAASIPSAGDTLLVDGRSVLRFHPLHKKVRDGIPRCIACGQIDEDGWHEAEWCPGCGGDLPFATSTLKLSLKADSGFRSESTTRLTLAQWRLINTTMHSGPALVRYLLDQAASVIESASAGETRSGSTEGESAVGDSRDAQTPSQSPNPSLLNEKDKSE